MAQRTPPPPSKPIERLFLLDGMALAYRAYFSFISRPLINSKGENTSAIFGFINTLMKILNDEKPEHIAVVFDTKQPTFRHIMYEHYKATRQKMPEEMSGQLEKLKEVVRAFNVPSLELPGFEADDIMGTLARQAEQEGIETYLVTGDKDFMQLISPLVKMYKPGLRGDEWETLDERAVMEKFGVTPDQVIDVLALVGDKSDNVPGVFGIGEKTAIPLIREFGNIENLLANVDKVTQKSCQQKLQSDGDNAILSKKLVTIDTKVPLDVDIHHLSARPRDTIKLMQLFAELEFKTLLKKLSEGVLLADEALDFNPVQLEYKNIATDEHTYHAVRTEKELKTLCARLKTAPLISVDTETSFLDPLQSHLVGISLAIEPREAWYIVVEENESERSSRNDGTPVPADPVDLLSPEAVDLFSNESSTGTTTKRKRKKSIASNPAAEEKPAASPPSNHAGIPLETIFKHLRPILTNPAIKKVGQNIKYDMLALASQGVWLEGVAFDTMVANYILRPDGQHNLDALAEEHLQYRMITYEDLAGKGRDQKHLREVDIGKLVEYSGQDADITLRLYITLSKKLEDLGQLSLGESIEFPLIPVLAGMEFAGVSLDVTYLADLSKEMERILQNIVKDIYSLCGEEFNINSTQQLSKILFEKLKLSIIRRTKTGYSTDVWVLEELRNEHPVIEKLLEYRQFQKLKSTYIDALPSLINPKTGRVHTSFNQTIASTGRLSSSNPNFQNIPIRTEIGRNIRKAFISGDRKKRIMSADYSQIELRIMAHISGDESLKAAFINNEDIHTTTAAHVFGVEIKDVTREMRRKAKEVNYGIMYGIGPYGLATRLDITQTEAKDLITRYFQRFPKVNEYISSTLAQARKDGFTSTLLGRRRYYADINSRNFNVRSNAERQAINMPIQGTAADMIKLAMINIIAGIRDEEIGARMILQVHDELVFEVEKNDEWRAKSLIVETMKTALPLSVPIEVECGVGNDWLEAH